MFCKNCGNQIKVGSQFCSNCGLKANLSKFVLAKQWIGNHKAIVAIGGALLFIVIIVLASSRETSYQPANNPTPNPISLPNQQIIPQPAGKKYSLASTVVNIICVDKNGDAEGGSGTILSSGGVVLTNAHIIPQRREVPDVGPNGCQIILPDESTGQPKEIYWGEPTIEPELSKEYDIAVFQIGKPYIDEDGKSWGNYLKSFPSFQFNDVCKTKDIKLGDSVRIYGYPVTSGGYNLTITEGIVSSFNDDGTILTTAQVDSGNSGGLAVDQDDCFVGIPSAVVRGNYQNLGVIIPPNLIKDFFDQVPER